MITVNYGITGNQYNLEFWFKTDPGRPDCELFSSTDVKAIVENEQFKIFKMPSGVDEITHDF